VNKLFTDPIVTVKGSHNVDVSLSHINDGKLAINLVNTSGPHADPNVYVFDEVIPLTEIDVAVNLMNKPKSVELLPSKQKVDWEYSDSKLKLTIPRIDLHEVLVIKE